MYDHVKKFCRVEQYRIVFFPLRSSIVIDVTRCLYVIRLVLDILAQFTKGGLGTLWIFRIKTFQPSLRIHGFLVASIHQAQHRHRRLQCGGRCGAGSTGLAPGSAGAAGRGTARIGGVVGDAGNSHESSRCLGNVLAWDFGWYRMISCPCWSLLTLTFWEIYSWPVYALSVLDPSVSFQGMLYIHVYTFFFVSAQLTDGYAMTTTRPRYGWNLVTFAVDHGGYAS